MSKIASKSIGASFIGSLFWALVFGVIGALIGSSVYHNIYGMLLGFIVGAVMIFLTDLVVLISAVPFLGIYLWWRFCWWLPLGGYNGVFGLIMGLGGFSNTAFFYLALIAFIGFTVLALILFIVMTVLACIFIGAIISALLGH
jgi:hypothetical protein